jgi:anaerobic magnesium-protoporphyrin IX monomethyl ester cyclase
MCPKVALVYPPTCDPTAPYLSVPTLCGYLRREGIEVLPVDANVEAYDYLLRGERIEALARKALDRLDRLEGKKTLTHVEQLLYATLWQTRGDCEAAPGAIDEAVSVMRDPERFFDVDDYDAAVATFEAAMRVVGAAHAPLQVSFTAYRTPFSLINADEIADDARPERNPYHDYYVELVARLRAAQVGVVGLSVAFPGQLQPAYSLAHLLRRELPEVHLTIGGPAITQILMRLKGEALAQALAPFDTAIIFEGERAIVELVRALERGEAPRGVIRGQQIENMGELPAPDFDGLPLDRYFAPELLLPYDPTRGCYWGVCTFCHYGLAEVGTAKYRERPVENAMADLKAMAAKHGNRLFYFSQDSVAPKTVLKLARAIRDERLPWRWATDMRPEKYLTPERCQELAEGGALAMAYGVESGADRVIQLIDKGIPVATVKTAIRNLADAGVAVEAMCFTDFPTETYREALSTMKMLEELRESVALFICGEFDLTHGALVAQTPGDYGIKETWQLDGDELGTGLFYDEKRPAKTAADQAKLDAALEQLSSRWRLGRYPWAGALSTAHTMLFYERFGPQVFKELAGGPAPEVPGAKARTAPARFDVAEVARAAAVHEASIWQRLVREERKVSRARYRELAAEASAATPSEKKTRWRFRSGWPVQPANGGGGGGRRSGGSGRRPSHAVNASKVW